MVSKPLIAFLIGIFIFDGFICRRNDLKAIKRVIVATHPRSETQLLLRLISFVPFCFDVQKL